MASSYASYATIGLLFLTLCPLLGGFFSYALISLPKMSSLLTAFAGGIMLGVGLLHTAGDAVNGIETNYPTAFLIAGCTILFLYFVAQIIPALFILVMMSFSRKMTISKKLVSVYALWCSLCVHGCFEGLAAGVLQGNVAGFITITALFLHKLAEYAALGTTLLIFDSVMRLWQYYLTLFLCELPCIICFIIALVIVPAEYNFGHHITSDGLFASLATGTFIYLALGHLIPEAMQLPIGMDEDRILSGLCNCQPVADELLPPPSLPAASDSSHLELAQRDVESKLSCCKESGQDNERDSEAPTIPEQQCCLPPITSLPPLSELISQQNKSFSLDVKSIVWHKLQVWFAAGFGFAVFALLALAPST